MTKQSINLDLRSKELAFGNVAGYVDDTRP